MGESSGGRDASRWTAGVARVRGPAWGACIGAVLAGCAATPHPLPPMGRIAVVSLVGDQARLVVRDEAARRHVVDTWAVPDWHVDDDVEARTAAQLQADGYAPVDVPVPADARRWLGGATWTSVPRPTWTFAGGPEAARRAASAAQADWLLVVATAPPVREDPFFHTSGHVTGYGHYTRGGESLEYAQLAVLLVDGHSGEVVKSRVGDGETAAAAGAAAAPSASAPALSREGTLAAIDAAVHDGLRRLKVE